MVKTKHDLLRLLYILHLNWIILT